jgi:predicted MFS family arabinose efflux permease
VVTTLFAGRVALAFGARPAFWGAVALAGVGLPLLLTESLPAVLAGLVLVGVGTFFAQAVTTGFVGRTATADKGSVSGIYLACYFSGGLAGTALLGQAFDRLGWGACVAGIALSLGVAAALAVQLKPQS